VPPYYHYAIAIFTVPVIANLGLWFMRVFINRTNRYLLSAEQILFVVVYVSFILWFVLPYFSTQYTYHLTDTLLYALGGLFFYKKMNKMVV
jgi:uncharacterized membrane protein YdbT with pleckstrin-like domain